ncbi:MAG: uroporphyrinogen-III C-methyltransferase [Elusimicrobia bacterium RIFOXYD2_FULL_34_15]|nr:MAG: uroporphyrinogen-III C-methyltransferase [Elusimicrobia bacterium RIFOXYD2_FULL_34_15]
MNSSNYSKRSIKHKVYIIGAGPGDPELITLKGINTLKKSECVIYDYLVNRDILKYVPITAELINADKVRNRFSDNFTKEQDKLNDLIVKKAKKCKIIIRLKNGDPVIFGRLNEEIEALIKNKIDFEIIPGITAASSAAAFLKVGLTKTKIAPIVSFITGHENPLAKNSEIDFSKLPKKSTLVFYMAVKNLNNIATELIKEGWEKNTPFAIVENVGFQYENKRVGRLKDMKKLFFNIKPPVILLVGDVLNYVVKKK